MSGSDPQILADSSAPCRHACPVDQNAKEYVALIAEGRFDQALQVILRTNPFPSVCGRVCSHPCELECRRATSGGPVAVRWLKRFVADRAAEAAGAVLPPDPDPRRRESIAVVGGGPAGITAAKDLARLGYAVTILEARDEVGGMMRWAIPSFRLPREVVQRESMEALRQVASVRTGVRLGVDVTLSDLLGEGFSAVLLATGCWSQASLGLPGDGDGENGEDTLRLLETGLVSSGSPARRNVVVVGATREGFDVASLACRAGARSVTLVTHLDETAFPVDPDVLRRVSADGVRIIQRVRVVSLTRTRGKVSGVVLENVTGRGKRRRLTCSILLPAVDRFVEHRTLQGCPEVRTTAAGTVLADPETLGTSQPGVFAAGDAATGPKTVIEAIATGHRAAASIHHFVAGERVELQGRPPHAGRRPQALEIQDPQVPVSARVAPLEGPADALREAQRCLRCGSCIDCETCHPDCPTTVAMLTRGDGRDIHSFGPHVKMDLSITRAVMHDERPLHDRYPVPVVVVPTVDDSLCLGCGRCADACPYDVIRMAMAPDGLCLAVIDGQACRSCGTCVGACPVQAVDQPLWDRDSLARAASVRGGHVALACRWGSPPEVATPAISLPCAGRVGEELLTGALASGASRVTVTGCGVGCRYRDADPRSSRVLESVKELAGIMGFDPRILGGEGDPAPASDGPPFEVQPLEDEGRTASPVPPLGRVMAHVQSILSHPEMVPRTATDPALAPYRDRRGDVLLLTGFAQFLQPLVQRDLPHRILEGTLQALAALERAGARPVLLGDERPCGLADGSDPDRLIRLLVESIHTAGVSTVVCTCAHEVRTLADGPLAGSPVRVMHLATYLDEYVQRPLKSRSRERIAILDESGDARVQAAASRWLRGAGHQVIARKWIRSAGVRARQGRGREGVIRTLAAARDAGARILACTSPTSALDLLFALRPGTWDGFGVQVRDLSTLLGGDAP